MKKLQNNFTTPEQSKRLLELGVPADSADCYYVVRSNYTAILINELFTECRDKMIKVSKTAYHIEMHNDDLLPCWSAGRLMEVIAECYQVDMPFRYFVRGGMMESLINTFIDLREEIDFSKLEE